MHLRPTLRLAAVACSILMLGARPGGVLAAPATCIHEYPHPAVVVHFHPRPAVDGSFRLAHALYALEQRAHAIELDLHYRASDGQAVCNHDGPTPDSPTLEQVVAAIMARLSGGSMYGDGRQFFLVLEPKMEDSRLFEIIYQVLDRHRAYLSTAVSPGDPPRGVTAVITGSYRDRFLEHLSGRFSREAVNRLCIVEGEDYTGQITNLSPTPFQWWGATRHDGQRGLVNRLHAGQAPERRGQYHLRVYFDRAITADQRRNNLRLALASGADAINCDRDELAPFTRLLGSQEPRGRYPTLAVRGSQVLLTWRGADSNHLYLAVGTVGPRALRFPRQVLMTFLLADTPQAVAPAGTLLPDGRLLLAYEGTFNQRLWYVSGRFTSADRFLTFDGREHRLTLPDEGRRGSDPNVAVAPDGRVVVIYQGTYAQRLWYVTGRLDASGEIGGQEHCLSQGDARRGSTPSIAIDPQGRVVVVYEGTADHRLWYVSGRLNERGEIVGREYCLSQGSARRGSTPSIAIDPQGRVVVVYEGTADHRLWYLSGRLDGEGRIVGREFCLTEGDSRRGYHPTVAFAAPGSAIILYEGTSDRKLWYVKGRLAADGRLVGEERLLDMGMDWR